MRRDLLALGDDFFRCAISADPPTAMDREPNVPVP